MGTARLATCLALTAVACVPSAPEGRVVASEDTGVVAMQMDAGLADTGTSTNTPPNRDCPQPTLASIKEVVFDNRCAVPDCHVAPMPREGLDLSSDLATLRARLEARSMQSPSGLPLIRPGNLGESYLYLKVFLPSPVEGGRMPLDRAPLETCQLQAIKDWVQAGASD